MACQSSVTQKGASPTSFFGSRLKINSFDPSFGCIVVFLGFFLNEQEFLEFESGKHSCFYLYLHSC